MNLDEALAVYLYLKDGYNPTMDERLQREAAWKMICESAKQTISMGLAFSPSAVGTAGQPEELKTRTPRHDATGGE